MTARGARTLRARVAVAPALGVLGVLLLLLAFAGRVLPVRADQPFVFQVGADAEDVTPPPAVLARFVAAQNFYLGGYGLGSSQGPPGQNGFPVPAASNRYAEGVMAEPLGHPHVRVVVISDGQRTIAFADLDNQGTFPAYQANLQNIPATSRPWGFDDVRAKVAADTHGGLNFFDMTTSSDHSHGGQDLTGAWGFVPDEYLRDVLFPAEVKAFETAYANLKPATIREGAQMTPGPCGPNNILNDQIHSPTCDGSDPNDVMDPEMRVMQAVDAANPQHVIFTLANFAAHATVMGSGNRLLSADWPGVTANYLQQDTGADVGIVVVSDVGRSQPNRQDCTGPELAAALAHLPGSYDVDTQTINGTDTTTEPQESCKLSKYARTAEAAAQQALAGATPLTTGKVDGREMFIHDCATNPGLLALNDAGTVAGAQIARANTPPYFDADCFGTWVGTFRIGDLVVTTNPGEAYPNIRDQFVGSVPGARRYWTTGLSNDQLGYLVAPVPQGYPSVIQAGVGGNDNILFNASVTIGDHVYCTQLKEAIAMGLAPSTAPPAKCIPFQSEPDVYAGGVTTGPEPTFPPPSAFSPPPSNVPEAPLTAALVFSGLGAVLTIWKWRAERASHR